MTQEMTGTRWSDARRLLEQAPADAAVPAVAARPQADADPWEATRPLTAVDTSWVEGEDAGPAAPPRGLRRRPRLVAASVLECKQVAARAGRHAIADLADLVADRLLETLLGAQRLDVTRAGVTVPAGTVLLLVPRGSRTVARLAEAVAAVAAEPLALAGRELRLTPVVGHSSVRDDERAAAVGRALVAMRVAAAAARRNGSADPVAWTRDLIPATQTAPAPPAAPASPAALPALVAGPVSPPVGSPAAVPAPAAAPVSPATGSPAAVPPPAVGPASPPVGSPAPSPATPVPAAAPAPSTAPADAAEANPSTGATRSARSGLSFGKRTPGRHAVR